MKFKFSWLLFSYLIVLGNVAYFLATGFSIGFVIAATLGVIALVVTYVVNYSRGEVSEKHTHVIFLGGILVLTCLAIYSYLNLTEV